MKANSAMPTGVRPGNKGGIEIRWSYKGKSYSEYVNEAPTARGLQRASKLREERIAAMQVSAGHRVVGMPTFADVVSEYLHKVDLAASTKANYRAALAKYWLPVFGVRPINSIGRKEVKAVMLELGALSRGRQHNVLIPFRQVIKFALFDREYISDDPTVQVRIRRGQRSVPDPFTREEREAVLCQLNGPARLFFNIAFETGLRCPSEILALQWNDIDGNVASVSKARVIRKLKQTTKTYEARHVLLTSRIATMLTGHRMKARSQWVFARDDGNPVLDADRFNWEWRRALRRAGVRYRRAYNCRHTYASLGLKAGAPPAFLAAQLGHGLQIFYSTYAKWINEIGDRAELEKIERYLSTN